MLLLLALACQPPAEEAPQAAPAAALPYWGELAMDLWLPEGEGPHTGLLLVHGGGFDAGGRDDAPMRLLAARAVEEGFAVVTPDYRLATPAVGFPDPVVDLACALAFAEAELPEVEGFGAMGVSAGATLAALLAVSPPDPGDCPHGAAGGLEAVVTWYGPTDWSALAADRPGLTRGERDFVGDDCQGAPAPTCAAASPARQAHAQAPPFFVVHGEDDEVVPADQAALLARALDEAEGTSRLVLLPDQGHGLVSDPESADTVAEALGWLQGLP